jgi:hypothetical protein
VVPTNVLQEAGGSGRTMRVGVAGWKPLSPWSPNTLQGPVWLTQALARTAARIKEFGA